MEIKIWNEIGEREWELGRKRERDREIDNGGMRKEKKKSWEWRQNGVSWSEWVKPWFYY